MHTSTIPASMALTMGHPKGFAFGLKQSSPFNSTVARIQGGGRLDLRPTEYGVNFLYKIDPTEGGTSRRKPNLAREEVQ